MFCVKCDRSIHSIEKLPTYKFPLNLLIYRHSEELNTKSSIYSLRYLTENCDMFEYPKDQ